MGIELYETMYMMTSTNGNIFAVTGPLWMESMGDKLLSKQSRPRWFEASDVNIMTYIYMEPF